MEPKLIYIEWQDAVANAQWVEKNDAEKWHDETLWVIKQVGWVVKEDAKGITVASRLKPEDNNTNMQYGGLQYIPKPWIIKRQTIKIK